MNRTNQFLLIFAVGLLTQPMLAHAQADYDYQTIDYPGTDYTQVFGINARGHVVGTASDEESCFPFVYHSKNATFTDVAPVAGFDCTHVLGISDSGYLVGGVTTDDPFSRSGLILDKSGNVTLFDHPDAFSETMARGVNNDGLVTGYIDTIDPNEILRGFIYDPETGTFTDIDPSIFTIAQGINSKGDVVGSSIFDNSEDPCGPSPDPGTVRYGWLRSVDGDMSYFIVNGWRTSARGITNSGNIVGFALDWETNSWWGFVTELDDTPCQSITIPYTDLLTVPEVGDIFVSQGINNTGKVVGWYEAVDYTTHGFIAIPE